MDEWRDRSAIRVPERRCAWSGLLHCGGDNDYAPQIQFRNTNDDSVVDGLMLQVDETRARCVQRAVI